MSCRRSKVRQQRKKTVVAVNSTMPIDPLIYATTDLGLDQQVIAALDRDLRSQMAAGCFDEPPYPALALVETKSDCLPDGMPPARTVVIVRPMSAYYGPNYERGHWPDLAAILEFLRRRIPEGRVWYGSDAADEVTVVSDDWMSTMWTHWAIHGCRPYDNRGRP